jgi:hypothetical protein
MTRFTQLILAAALGGTALAGTAYAAQDQAQPTPSAAGMHRHHRGHGDPLARMDANKDGVVTRAEAIAAADARFAKADTNNDGKITQDEVQAQRDAMRARMEQRRAAQGARAGANGAAHQPGGHRGMHPRGHRGDMTGQLDANGDGVVTRAEAEAAATAHFDKMDANHDGRIDQSEMAAIKAKMQARMAAKRAKWQARQAAAPASTDQSTDR